MEDNFGARGIWSKSERGSNSDIPLREEVEEEVETESVHCDCEICDRSVGIPP